MVFRCKSKLSRFAVVVTIFCAVLSPISYSLEKGVSSSDAYGYAFSPVLDKFVDSLTPVCKPDNSAYSTLGYCIPIAKPVNYPADPNSDYYQIGIRQYSQQMHSGLPNQTVLRGYYDRSPNAVVTKQGTTELQSYLGPIIVAQSNRPVRVTFRNELPLGNAFLPVDTTIMGAEGGQNRTAIHLHGGFVPWISDGTPNQWFTPSGVGQKGVSYVNVPDMAAPAAFEWNAYYPNLQSARMLWYHDHAVGITRTNVYAGMASAFLITDATEAQLVANGILPADNDGLGIPLIIQDKSFVDAATIATQDPTWAANADWGQFTGALWYPHVYEPNQNLADGTPNPTGRWDFGGWVYPPVQNVQNPPAVSAVAEAFQDTSLVNGVAYPYMNVEQRKYRFRVLNAAGARAFNLQLYMEAQDINLNYTGEADLAQPGPAMLQIANEGGVLPAAVEMNNPPTQWGAIPTSTTMPTSYTLLVAPAERADIIVDFSALPPGARLILYNDAPAPAPDGDPRDDYYTGDPDQTAFGGAATTLQGKGPNTRTMMEFRVVAGGIPDTVNYAATKAYLQDANTGLPAIFAQTQPRPIVAPGTPVTVRDTSVAGIPVKIKTLNENFDSHGRLNTQIGTNAFSMGNQGSAVYGTGYEDMPTETVFNRQPQIWTVVNNTGDTHPIHIHLENVQLVARMDWAGNVLPPDPNELGWKETIRMLPGTNAIVAVKFSPPRLSFGVPQSVRPLNATRPFNAVTNPLHNFGFEYIWHCHMLEHEEHDMMHVIQVYNPYAPPAADWLLMNGG